MHTASRHPAPRYTTAHGPHSHPAQVNAHAEHSAAHTLLSAGERSTGVPEFGPSAALVLMRMRTSFATNPILGRRIPADAGMSTTWRWSAATDLAAKSVRVLVLSVHDAEVKAEKTPLVSTVVKFKSSDVTLVSVAGMPTASPSARLKSGRNTATHSPDAMRLLSENPTEIEAARPSPNAVPSVSNSPGSYASRVTSPVKAPTGGDAPSWIGSTTPCAESVLTFSRCQSRVSPSAGSLIPSEAGTVTESGVMAGALAATVRVTSCMERSQCTSPKTDE
mmetsp:Transcript_3990/g.8072  ORF Transcript_3990/g.8072 Transcript_3990/m.8072 type:complete len:278 (-) Transcript_3990:990-1823(-)